MYVYLSYFNLTFFFLTKYFKILNSLNLVGTLCTTVFLYLYTLKKMSFKKNRKIDFIS